MERTDGRRGLQICSFVKTSIGIRKVSVRLMLRHVGSCCIVQLVREVPARRHNSTPFNTSRTSPTQPSDQTGDVDSLGGSISPALNVGRVAIAGSEEVRVRVRVEGEGEVIAALAWPSRRLTVRAGTPALS